MIEKRLGDIAEVFLGYTFRKAVENVPAGGHCVVQAKDISADGFLADVEQLTRFNGNSVFGDKHPRSELVDQDLLLRVRGSIFSAAIYKKAEASSSVVVASSQIAIIRCQNDPEMATYLHWFLNSTYGEVFFAKQTAGSDVAMLSAQSLKAMPVLLPHETELKALSELWSTWSSKKTAALQQLLAEEHYVNGLMTIAHEKHKTAGGM